MQADFLLLWKPFHYALDASVDIGASFTLDLLVCSVTITIHVGVDLSLWGPPFGGTATVDLDVISFTIGFGADQPDVPKLGWVDFAASFLPHPPGGGDAVLCKVDIRDGLVKDRTGESAPSIASAARDTTSTPPVRWLINPTELDLAITSPLPVRAVQVDGKPAMLAGPRPPTIPRRGSASRRWARAQASGARRCTWHCPRPAPRLG